MLDGPGYWLFLIPNFILAAAMYTLLGRYFLSVFFKVDSDRVIWRVFRQITDPVLKFLRSLTPRVVPDGLVMVFSIFWLLMFRVLLLIAAVLLGFSPNVNG